MTAESNTPLQASSFDSNRLTQSVDSEKVALIIVNFFSMTYLKRALAALESQSRRPDRIFIVNNGDEPGALDFVMRDYPDVFMVERDNIGFAAANNLAIAELKSYPWIALLNPDAFPEPLWLEALLQCASDHPGADIFSSQMIQEKTPQILDGCGDCYHISGLAWRGQHGKRQLSAQACCEVFSACGAAALFRRAALLEVGGFDENFFCYFEDVDLGFRLRLFGFRCIHVPTAIVLHVGSVSSGGEQSDFAVYHGHRNLVWTFVKNMPGVWFWLLLPLHIMLNVIEVFWFSMKGRAKVICRAKLDAIKSLPSVWLQRQQVQKGRTVSSSAVLKSMSLWPRVGWH